METSAEPSKSPERQTLTAERWAPGAEKGFAQDPVGTKGEVVEAKPVLALCAAFPPHDFAVLSRPSDTTLQLLGPQVTGNLDITVREEGRPNRSVSATASTLECSVLVHSLTAYHHLVV